MSVVARTRPAVAPLDPNAYYSASYLAARYDVHVVTIYKWITRRILPRPTKLAPNTSRWLGADILAHERERREAQQGGFQSSPPFPPARGAHD